MITIEELKQLKYGDIIYSTIERNADGSAQRWRVNGKPKTWKTRPDQVLVPLKRGLYQYGYVTENSKESFSLIEKGGGLVI